MCLTAAMSKLVTCNIKGHELVSNDNISEVISRTSRRSGATKNINITNRRRPARSINLNLGN